ncbi:MAG: DUF3095 domain-containing protein [Rhodospirillales bacterium]|nr:DUF3095 domain-containing protein [Rhodospirillales bacterium]
MENKTEQKPVTPPNQRFYADMPSFGDFSQITEISHYRPAPDDWLVVIADIRGSTDAILAGRYKDVNMVGAATITAVINVTHPHETPFVFGGDGATLMIPPQSLPAVRQALVKTRHLAKAQFGLNLRIGAVPVHRVRAENTDVLVAKYRLSPGNHMAVFYGGGVSLADQLIKQDDGSQGYLFDDEPTDGDLNLGGLSCRWEPLAARRGVMLSMLIQALPDKARSPAAIYHSVLQDLAQVLASDPEANKPVGTENIKFRWPPKGLEAEARTSGGRASYPWRLLRLYGVSLFQLFLHRFGLKAGSYDAPLYNAELRANSDFRRFDDTLRMVLDCTEQEVTAITSVLNAFRGQGTIAYGLHEADSALMTCLVFSLTDGEHVHFIDGADGGFSIAARGLKQQLAAGVGGDQGPGTDQ